MPSTNLNAESGQKIDAVVKIWEEQRRRRREDLLSAGRQRRLRLYLFLTLALLATLTDLLLAEQPILFWLTLPVFGIFAPELARGWRQKRARQRLDEAIARARQAARRARR